MSKPFFGGVPTDVDVRSIRDVFPESEMKPGMEIPYSDIAELIGSQYGSCRFKTVTSRWRKIVEAEASIIIGTKPGESFVVLTECEKVDLSSQKIRMAGRNARRSWVVMQKIDRPALTEEERKRLDHTSAVAAKVLALSQIRTAPQLPQI